MPTPRSKYGSKVSGTKASLVGEGDNLGIQVWLRSQRLTEQEVERTLARLEEIAEHGVNEPARELARRRRHALREAWIAKGFSGSERDCALAAERWRREEEKNRFPWSDHWKSY
jgi:hypothetical protein